MRKVRTARPSFPEAPPESPLPFAPCSRWQVLCGDAGHWRAGIYSPAETSPEDVKELERHDCPELFVLLSGNLTLLLREGEPGKDILLPLEPLKPVLVKTWHCGFCPGGPHSGAALVIERDEFETEYINK